MVLIIRELERDEKARIANLDRAAARQVAGRTWMGLWKRFNNAMHEKWWSVTRWSVEQRAKRKELRAHREYRAITKIFNGAKR